MRFLVKWLLHLSIIYGCGHYFGNVNHPFYVSIILTTILVPLSYWSDLMIMPKYGNFQSAVVESLGIFAMIAFAQFLLNEGEFTFMWPFWSAFFVLIFEVILHRWMIERYIYAKT